MIRSIIQVDIKANGDDEDDETTRLFLSCIKHQSLFFLCTNASFKLSYQSKINAFCHQLGN